MDRKPFRNIQFQSSRPTPVGAPDRIGYHGFAAQGADPIRDCPYGTKDPLIVPPRPTDPEDPTPDLVEGPIQLDQSEHRHSRLRTILDVLVLLVIIAAMLALVVVARADTQSIAAATAFTIAVYGLWFKYRS
ncbi:hypothetical protein [Nocardia sp. NPDC056000]|uniref:hypothetical protein n=1 Tax=Nocardia sp. NPDC056000 TaxID=3345674 RepID=UPI0035D80E37